MSESAIFKIPKLSMVLLFVVGSLVASNAFAFAQTPGQQETQQTAQMQQQRPEGRRQGDLFSQLNLTPDQVEKIRAIRDGQKLERRAIVVRLAAARKALDDAIYGANPDEAIVAQRAKELADAQSDSLRLQSVLELKIRQTLNADQLATFLDLRQKAQLAQQRPRDRGEMGRPPGAGNAFRQQRQNQRGLNGPGNSNTRP